jgi:hypothetical protein
MSCSKLWMSIVVMDTEVVFSKAHLKKNAAKSAVVKYLCENEDFDVNDFEQACSAICEDNLNIDLMVFEMDTEHLKRILLPAGLLVKPPSEDNAYRIVYAIDIIAGSANQAARLACKIMSDSTSLAPVLEVIDSRGKIKQIDLTQQN